MTEKRVGCLGGNLGVGVSIRPERAANVTERISGQKKPPMGRRMPEKRKKGWKCNESRPKPV